MKAGALAPLVSLFTRVEDALAGCSTPALLAAFSGLMLRRAVRRSCQAHGLPVPTGALCLSLSSEDAELEQRGADDGELSLAIDGALGASWFPSGSAPAPEALGTLFESLLGLDVIGEPGHRRLVSTRRRQRTGSYYTPAALTEVVVGRALDALAPERLTSDELSICDPACGAGAFLVETARALVSRAEALSRARGKPFDARGARRAVVERVLAGVDLDPRAIDVARLVLWTFVADPELELSAIRLEVGDALTGPGFDGAAPAPFDEPGVDWSRAFARAREHGFDLVIGNPPWVAFAGRAAKPLSAARRAWFSERYAAFRGYPTLQALFVQRALELAPRGVVALLVPSPLADLAGYRAVRRRLLATHVACEPLLEFGQDAFAEVTQPCFALIARPQSAHAAAEDDPERALVLSERARASTEARALAVPPVLERLRRAAPLPPETFGEMGFQTTRAVSAELLLRSSVPDRDHTYPLLEGRDVVAFRVGPPRLFLRADPELLRRARCRLRSADEYHRVRFVVRQTAKAPIAALHTGLPFRNSLLAGFETEALPADLLVGLLNSALYRALHLVSQRDARQAVFPQVKISHLRALPRPPQGVDQRWEDIRRLVRGVTERASDRDLRRALDLEVFALFQLSGEEASQVLDFLRDRAPELLP